jgi:WXXGXW repeat (2 copies)
MNRRNFFRLAPLIATTLAGAYSLNVLAQPVQFRPQAPQPSYVGRPIQAPPPPRNESRPRPPKPHGYVWTDGYWAWNNGRYTWESGHWVTARQGKRWTSPRWQQQGQSWVFIDGRWN